MKVKLRFSSEFSLWSSALAWNSRPKSHHLLLILVWLPATYASTLRDFDWAIYIGLGTTILGVITRIPWPYLIVVTAPFDFSVSWPVAGTLNLSLVSALVMAVAALITRPQVLRKFNGIPDRIWIWILLFVLTALIQFVANVLDNAAFFLVLVKMASGIAVFGLAILASPSRPRQLDSLHTLGKMWLLSSSFSLLLGLVGFSQQVLFGVENLLAFPGDRMTAGFGNPNSFAAYHTISLGVALAMVIGRVASSRWLVLASLPLEIIAISQSASQTALLSAVAIILTTVLLQIRVPQSAAKVGASVLLGGAISAGLDGLRLWRKSGSLPLDGAEKASGELPVDGAEKASGELPALVTQSLQKVGDIGLSRIDYLFQQISGDQRWQIWQNALDLWKQNPFFGIGLGNFRVRSDLNLEAHSSQVQLLVEGGLVLWCLFALPTFALGFALIGSKKLNAMLPLLVGTWVFSFGQNLLYLSYFWFIIGIIYGSVRAIRSGLSPSEATVQRDS